ncbi:FAD-binding oxidoreductase [uncultured Prochlorococcus sp.]|uniref:FAD-binding oxidoreductase n=1 Tax=uncultured Prochlorococcus sp. TaxID=159733 RepID=UPI002588AC35|nr:FAD-binding oxidoreductase [uncultured Prochlorococcus sp.]
MTIKDTFLEQKISGWGGYPFSDSKIYVPSEISQLQEIISESSPKSIIGRGLGRSYGNPAQRQNGNVVDLRLFNKISLDSDESKVIVGGGVSIDDLLKEIVPKGFFVPVSPGTRFVTIGGAIAADVHGKNHHVDGSFCNFIDYIKLIDGNGKSMVLSPNNLETKEFFWATCGGMGLTGFIIEAKLSLIPIKTSLMNVYSERINNLDSLMQKMIEHDYKYKYNVAWIDSLSKQGRGVLTSGEHASLDQIEKIKKSENDPLKYDPKAIAGAPTFLPSGVLNNFTVKLFNEGWFRKAPKIGKNNIETISSYFHPLDGIANWNKIYGPKGFLQYQFAVPDHSSHLISKTLESLRTIGAPSFLTVLKRFGTSNSGYLSFPMKGWTLAADVPIAVEGLFEVLNDLDEEVANAGGKLYLAKDSRQSELIFKKTYPKYFEWKKIKLIMDPNFKFYSDLAERIGI